MQILDPGHQYFLDGIDGHGIDHHYGLCFVKRRGNRYPGNTESYPGTTSQEVLRALIDRAKYVNKQIPCWQTRLSIHLLRLVIWLYEHRAASVHGWMIPKLTHIELVTPCPKCGHITCEHDIS